MDHARHCNLETDGKQRVCTDFLVLGSWLRQRLWVVHTAKLICGCSCVVVAGCAAGTPTLHPAHVLPSHQVRFGAGMSGQLVLGGTATAINTDATASTNSLSSTDRPPKAYVSSVLTSSMVAPGVAPFVSARTGLGGGWEAGLAYTGRQTSLDARHAWQGKTWALSVGGEAGALLLRPARDGEYAAGGYRLEDARGWSAQVPIIVGWRSEGAIAWAWWGVKGRYESATADVVRVQADHQAVGALEGRAMGVDGLFGFAVGGGGVHAALEIDGGWVSVRGTAWGQAGESAGFTLTPSAALLATF